MLVPVELQGQLALEHGEALDDGGVAVLADDARPNQGGQLAGHAAFGILVGKLQDRGALTGDGVLPDLADLDRREVWRTVRVRMRHVETLVRARSSRALRARRQAHCRGPHEPSVGCRVSPAPYLCPHVYSRCSDPPPASPGAGPDKPAKLAG
jgi:hypothetical protein